MMKLTTKTLLMACCLLVISGGTVLAQPGPCDPASAPNTPGSCQFPNITFPNGGPDCYICQVGQPNTCVPDDTFCEGIAGGDSDPNACRIAVCDPNATGSSLANPTGCDFVIDPSPTPIPQCFLCNDSTAPFANHCPNGGCEPDLGENVGNCPLDCLVPGMATPLPTDAEMNAACNIPSITFPGPPFNQPSSGFCEDGNVCTTDFCPSAGGICQHDPNNCSLDRSDLCCAPGCHPPAAGGICGNDTSCDIDCKQIACPLPTPSPTPIPTPVFSGCLEGSGVFAGTKNGPGCGGSSCSLNPAASPLPGFGLGLVLAAGLGLGAYRRLRRLHG